MGIKVPINNFTGGEIAPSLSARYDLPRYKHSLRLLENFLPGLHGDVKRRMGMRYVGELGGPSVIIPFSFSVERSQNFVLIFSERKMRVGNETLLFSDSVAAPYLAEDLYALSWAQVGDVVYIAHPNYSLHKVERRGGSGAYHWSITPVALNISIFPPATPTGKWTGDGGDFTLRYKVVAVDANGKQSLPSAAAEIPNAKFPSDWVVGNSATITWQAVQGAVEYNVYREQAGYYGLIGVVSAENVSGGQLEAVQIGAQKVYPTQYGGTQTRTVVTGRQGYNQDTTSAMSISQQAQNAFVFDGKIIVRIAKTTNTTVWVRERRWEQGNWKYYWVSSTSSSTEYLWGMVTVSGGNPVGSYASYDVGTLEDRVTYPEGTVGPYTLSPVFAAGGTISFTDQNYEADTTDTPREDWDPFKDGNNPSTVSFHQQRMVLGGTRTEPQAFYLSRVGDFENFRKSRPLQEDDPVEYVLASGSIDSIAWTASFGDLLLGTAGAEYKATGESGVLTAKSVQITSQSYWGSARLMPIIVGNSILHVQRHGSRVRDLFYSLEKDGYAGNDLSIMAPHLFDGHQIIQWGYQQTPGSIVWAVREDGVLLALTYLKEHDIWGWSRHTTKGKVRSVAIISGDTADVVMVVVEREGRYFLERMEDDWPDDSPVTEAFYVDCGITLRAETPQQEWGGLGHLEGREVAVLAGGSPVEGLTVQGGKITIPYPVNTLTVGLPYSSILVPMPQEADGETGTTLSRMRGYGLCTLRLSRTVGGKYGPDAGELYDLPFTPEVWGDPCVPYTGDIECNAATAQRPDTSFWVVQDKPLPMHIVAIVLDVDFVER